MLPQNEVRESKRLFDDIARDKSAESLEHESLVDHAHMLLRVEQKQAVMRAINDLTGVSSRRIFLRRVCHGPASPEAISAEDSQETQHYRHCKNSPTRRGPIDEQVNADEDNAEKSQADYPEQDNRQ